MRKYNLANPVSSLDIGAGQTKNHPITRETTILKIVRTETLTFELGLGQSDWSGVFMNGSAALLRLNWSSRRNALNKIHYRQQSYPKHGYRSKNNS